MTISGKSSYLLPLACSLILSFTPAEAADHREAPGIAGASQGDLTDVYAFLNPHDKTRIVFILGVNPFAVPTSSQSYRFSDSYLYQFKIDNNGDVKEDIVVQVKFDTVGSTQMVHVRTGPPAAVGAVNTLIGDAAFSAVDGPTNTVFGDPTGVQVFAGLRDDPFVLDIGQFFRITVDKTQEVFRDLPNTPLGPLRGRALRADGTSGIDSFAGFNASFIAVEMPVSYVLGPKAIINIWGTVSAPVEQLSAFLQFEREGQPAFNTIFIPGPLKDAVNQGIPSDDVARYSQFVPDALTTTDNDGTGNTIAGRVTLLNALGVTAPPNGAPLILPATFVNTNKDLLRNALLPDVLRLNLNADPNDLQIGQFGVTNGRRPADDSIDIELQVVRQLADVNFPASLKVPGSGPARTGALTFGDARITAVLQGTDFIRPDSTLTDLTVSGNDKPIPDTFPYLGEKHPRPGDPGTVGYPSQINRVTPHATSEK